MKRPEKDEYAAFYETYVSLVNESDVVFAMKHQLDELRNIFSQIPEEKGTFAYAEGKWSIKELLGHLIDGERVFAYRAFRFGRGDTTPLPGFDQDPYVENGHSNDIPLEALFEEFSDCRRANLHLFKSFNESDWDRRGIASENPVSVRALAYVMVGHIRHHVKVLKEKYLAAL